MITISLLVINERATVPTITLIALGGMLRASEFSMIGHLTEQSLADVRADKIFFGVRVIDITHGLTNDYSPETSTDRAILAIGRRLIVVADHTKCGRIASAVIAPLSDVHTLVTDNAASGDFIAALQARGVRTCIA